MEMLKLVIGFLTFAVPGAIVISMLIQQFNREKQNVSGNNESPSHKNNHFL